MGMAYDAARQEVLLFGGSPTQGHDEGALGDTWTWDGSTWTERAPPTSPPGRYGMGMAYDAALREVVLFGGSYSYPDYFGDTWTWDGTTWTQQSSSRFPPSRVRMGMAYDALQRQVVLFGGFDGGVQKLGDTWLWDGSQWTMASPATSPDPREGVAMAYDRTRGLVVLFGGKIGKAPWDRDDTWTWDGSNWTQEPPAPSPSQRHTAGMANDGTRGRVLLFGGCSVEGLCPMGDTWTWDGASWTEQAIMNAPSARK